MPKNTKKGKEKDSELDLADKMLDNKTLAKRAAAIPSSDLLILLESFANDVDNFFDNWEDYFLDKWEKIKEKGKKEGFSEVQLVQMVRPFLKQRGLSKSKIYYLFHREEQKERVKRRKFNPMHNKNGTVKNSTNNKENGLATVKAENPIEFLPIDKSGEHSQHSSPESEELPELKVNQHSGSPLKDHIKSKNGQTGVVPIRETNTQATVTQSEESGRKVTTYFDLIDRIPTNCENHPMYKELKERTQQLQKVLEEKSILIEKLSKANEGEKLGP